MSCKRTTLLALPFAALLALIPSSASAYPDPGRVTGSVVTHDPSMIRTSSGQYLLYATGGGWSCGGGNNQKWRLEDLGDDTHRLVNVATGKVLDTENCSSTNGADLRQWTWLNNTCQQWRLMPV